MEDFVKGVGRNGEDDDDDDDEMEGIEDDGDMLALQGGMERFTAVKAQDGK